MNFEKIRRIDKYLGIPLCFLFTCIRQIYSIFTLPRQDAQKPKRILFLKLIEQGSTVLIYDSLSRAAEKYGRENLYFWVFKENRPILDLLDVLPPENVIEVRNKNLMIFAWDILKSLVRIRSLRIDALIDMEFFARAPAILAFLSGIPMRIGLHRFNSEAPYRGDLFTHRIQFNLYLPTALYFRTLVDALEAPIDEIPLLKRPVDPEPVRIPQFIPSEAEATKIRNLLLGLRSNIFDGPIVILNANASDMIPQRKWASERYVDLGKRILRDFPSASILLSGAPSEAHLIEPILDQFQDPRVLSMAGKTSLRELIILFTMSDLLITNDSGPSHFSSLTNIQTITLFGPETPLLYGAIGPGKKAITSELYCSPCVSVLNHRFTPCTNNLCMQVITVDKVYRQVKEILSGLAAKGSGSMKRQA